MYLSTVHTYSCSGASRKLAQILFFSSYSKTCTFCLSSYVI